MTQGTQPSPYNTNDFVLGIDAGGTSLRLVFAERTSGQRIAEVEGVASPDGGPEALIPLVSSLFSHIAGSSNVVAVCAGITKFTREGVVARWEQTLSEIFPTAAHLVVPDYVIAFHGALSEGLGLTVVSGTGSVVYGEDGVGGTIRVGGRGWEYGDEGSGAHLTAESIRRTLRALDGMEEKTPLAEAICQFLGTTEPALLAELARQRAATDGRGFLVPLILERAQGGDSEAVNLFVGAAGWLAAWVRSAYRQLDFRDTSSVSIATIGGMWSAGELITTPFTQVIHRWIPQATVHLPEDSPVGGAIRMARRLRLD